MAWEDSLIGGAAGMAVAGINNYWADKRTAKDRAENYMYGEMAANQADKRTRALYNDFYSPEALLRQYQEAGLSPSLMFGGTPGQGGLSGAKGTGAMGPQTPFMPMSLVEAAQAAQLFALTDKTKAETENISKDTTIKSLEADLKTMEKWSKDIEYRLYTLSYAKGKSFSEMARECDSEEVFLGAIRKLADMYKDGQDTEGYELYSLVGTEYGQEALRKIYRANKQFDRDIAVLSEEKVDANFQKEMINALKDQDIANLNAQALKKQLEASKASNELTREQKEAIDHMIDKIDDGWVKDVALIIFSIAQAYINNSGGHVNATIPIGNRNEK